MTFLPNKFFIISGPCMAESLQMMIDVAGAIKEVCKKYDVQYIFKASFDKANRSLYNSERGPGTEKGLEWLYEVRTQFNIPVTTDFHETHQLKYSQEIDIIQIPAFLSRQTDLIQEAFKTEKTVNIKMGQWMGLEEKKMLIDKCLQMGNLPFLTERGNYYGSNDPRVDMRSIPLLKDNGVTAIYDATHTTINHQKLCFPMAKAALIMGADGLFFEVHPDPSEALCDRESQQKLSTFIEKLPELIEFQEKNQYD